jgi:hypothetical protein
MKCTSAPGKRKEIGIERGREEEGVGEREGMPRKS